MNFPLNINQFQLLNGLNYQKWKADIELNPAILNIDQMLKQDPPIEPPENVTKEQKDKYLKWLKHSKMALICIKKSMNDVVKGGIPDSEFAKEHYNSIVEKCKTYDKADEPIDWNDVQ